METTTERANTFDTDAFALPTRSLFSLENSNNTSLSLLSSNADTHYSLGMSYILLLCDMEDENDNKIMKKQWMHKSHLHLVACASVYSCMIGRICDVKEYNNADDIGHVTIDGESIGWKNFQEEGFLKTQFFSSDATTKGRKLSTIIQMLRERTKYMKPTNSNNIPIIEAMKEILKEIQETIDSPDDSMKVILSLSKLKAKVASETEQRIKRETLAGKIKKKGKSSKDSMFLLKSNTKSTKQQSNSSIVTQTLRKKVIAPGKRQRTAVVTPHTSPDGIRPKKTTAKTALTPLKLSVSQEQRQNILSPSAFVKSKSPVDNNGSQNSLQNANAKLNGRNHTNSMTNTASNLNLWEIGSPIFRDAKGGEESLKVLKESRKELWSPLAKKKTENDVQSVPSIVDSPNDHGASTLWKNAPSSLKTKVSPNVRPQQKFSNKAKKPKTIIRKKVVVENVHANYDSRRHNRYRPMMKSSGRRKPLDDRPIVSSVTLPPAKTLRNAPKGEFSLTFL